MRVTESYRFNNYYNNQQRVSGGMNDVLGQINSGLKIKFGNEDPTAFINTLRLDQEINTLKQTTSNMTSAQKFANHTDTTLNDITTSLDKFKTKLIYAASESHSSTSYGAIATELEGIRDHLMALANTNINGEFLFSGSATSVKPISEDGTYNGNDLDIEALTASDVRQAYNVTGQELFLGQDSDYSKKITTNVVLYNQRELHPDVMDPVDIADDPKEVYITAEDTIRDLVGDNDLDETNDGNYNFYVSGTQSSGKTFKDVISVPTDNTVDSLLKQIGEAYGNTSNNQVVDVQLNNGRIEITDLQQGSSKLDFHMFGSNTANNDVDALVASGAQIKEFTKSPYQYVPTMQSVTAMQDQFDPNRHQINSSLRTDEKVAEETTPLGDILPSEVDHINFSGTDTTGAAVNVNLAVAGSNVDDLLTSIEANFGNVNASITKDGKIQIDDKSTTGNFAITLEAQDAANNPVTGFGNDVASMQRVEFEHEDSYLRSNVAQVVSATNEYAKDTTKLSEVASGGTMVGTTLDLDYTDISGTERSATITFNAGNVQVDVDSDKDGAVDSTFNVLNAEYNDANTNGSYDIGEEIQTQPDEMTYKQLEDVVAMLTTNQIPAAGDRTDYNANADAATARMDVFIDQNGKLTLKDTAVADTNVRFAMSDANSGDFGAPASSMSFMENNALTVDDVHIDMFSMIDEAIESVRRGFKRPDGEGHPDMQRSVGIQNLLDQFEHVFDHTVRKHTEIGATSQSFDYQISRNETLEVHTKTLRSDIIDVDYAEAVMNLNQLQLNYEAMLSSMSKIQKLSLVNYL